MRKEVRKLMKELDTCTDPNQVSLIKSKLDIYRTIDNDEIRRKELNLKSQEVAVKQAELDLKKELGDKELKLKEEDITMKRVQNEADLNIKREEVQLHKDELELKKAQTLSTAKSAFVNAIVTAALATTKLGAYSFLSIYMHKKENESYEKESTFSKELRQGLLK